MAVLNFSDSLMEARRKAQLQGRPLSQGEMQGITEAYAKTSAERLQAQKQMDLAEKGQEAQKEQFAQTLAMNQEQNAAQAEQFAQTLSMNLEQNRERAGEFQKNYELQAESQRKQMEAADAARRSQETASYVGAGVSIASIILMALILA